MRTTVIIEKDENGFSAFTENLKTVLHGSGKSVKDAKEELMACYEDIKDSYANAGKSIPKELQNLTFDYRYDISALFDDFRFLNISQFAREIGINTSLMHHYKKGDTYISASQAKKIETGLHQIGRRFLTISL